MVKMTCFHRFSGQLMVSLIPDCQNVLVFEVDSVIILTYPPKNRFLSTKKRQKASTLDGGFHRPNISTAASVRFSNFAGLPFCPAASSYQWTSGQLSSSSLEIIKKEQQGFSEGMAY